MVAVNNANPDDLLGKAYDSRIAGRLLGLLLPYKQRLAIVIIAALTAIATDLLLPLLFGMAVDEVAPTGSQSYRNLNLIGVAVVGALLVRFIAQWVEMYLTSWLGNRVVYDLRDVMFRHLQRLSMSYIDRRGVGSVMTRIQNDVAVINELFTDGVIGLMANLVVIVGIVVIMLVVNWQLALLACLAIPAMVFVVAKWRKYAVETYRDTRRTISIVNADLAESIDGVRVVQAFNQEENKHRRFSALNNDNLRAAVNAAKLGSLMLPITIGIGAAATVLVLYAGGRLVFDLRLTVGELVLFIALVDRFFMPIRELAQQYTLLQAGMAAGERIFDLLDTEPEVEDKPDAIELPPVKGHVRFENVTFGYRRGGEMVLHGIDLDVPPGHMLALVGETGAGKSTIISLLLRFADVWDGRVTIDGYDVRDVTQESLRRQCGVVLQEAFLFPGSVRENLRFARPDATDEEIEEAAKLVGAHDFIMALPDGYDTPLHERGNRLSAGERQLIAFARAVLADPRILILDEATSNIDAATEYQLQQAQRRLLAGRTAIVVAHRLTTIRDADAVVVLRHGRVVERGTHDELVAQGGYYAELVATQWREGEIAAD